MIVPATHREICYHEAGHAVCVRRFGIDVIDAIVGPHAKPDLGVVHYARRFDPQFFRAEAYIAVAGCAAEGLFATDGNIELCRRAFADKICGDDNDFHAHWSAVDWILRNKHLRSPSRCELKRLSRRIIHKTLNAMKYELWPAVSSIAAALEAKEVLTGDEVAMLYRVSLLER